MPDLIVYDAQGTPLASDEERNERVRDYLADGLRLAVDASGGRLEMACFLRARDSPVTRSKRYYATFESSDVGDYTAFVDAVERRLDRLGKHLETAREDVTVYRRMRNGTPDEPPGSDDDRSDLVDLLEWGHRVRVGVPSYEDAVSFVASLWQRQPASSYAIVENADGDYLEEYAVVVEKGADAGLALFEETADALERMTDQRAALDDHLETARTSPEDLPVEDIMEFTTADAPRARALATEALAETARDCPAQVRSVVDGLQSALGDDEPTVRREAARALGFVAAEYPENVRPAAEDLRALLAGDNEATLAAVTRALGTVAETYPEEGRRAADELRTLLYDDAARVRGNAARALAAVAGEFPGDVRQAVDRLRDLLGDGESVREHAALALARVAKRHPEDVRPAVDPLRALLADEHRRVRRNAARALAQVASTYPEEVEPAVADLRPLLEDDDWEVRAEAARPLAEIARGSPEVVRSTADRLRALLYADHERTRVEAASALGALAEACPEATRPAAEKFRTLLGGESTPPAELFRANTGAVADLDRTTSDGPLITFTLTHGSERGRLLTFASDHDLTRAEAEAFERSLRGWYNGNSHPNVCSIRGRGTEPSPWVVLDTPGTPLADCMDSLDPPGVLSVVEGVVEALRTLALYRTTHHDLSPNCVRVVEDGDVAAVVDDWGLERAVREARGGRYVTAYTAPEQLGGDSVTTGEPTDLYGLGAVTYHALTGHPPTPAEATAIREGDIAPPSAEAAVPSALDEVVLRALATEPDERYGSVFAFGRALRDAL